MDSDEVKLVYHNAENVSIPEESISTEEYPWVLNAVFSPPEFMQLAFICIYGGSEVVRVLGKTEEALEKYAKQNGFRNVSRLRNLEIIKREIAMPAG